MIPVDTLAAAYMNIWNAGQDHLLTGLASKHVQVHYSHFEKPLQGVDAYRKVLQMTCQYFPDIRITVNEIIPATNMATVHWQYTGTHKSGDLFGAKPTGRLITVSGISVLQFDTTGLVTREFGIVDNLSLVVQLGRLKL